jgi:dephospho-CoA kinase
MILGITGSYCSGKDAAAQYITQNKGFLHFSLSDILREKMKEQSIETTRENLIVFGTKLRQEDGNGALAKIVLSKIKDDLNYCITSIRHPAEVETLAQRKDFTLVFFDASTEIRFQRMLKRNREGDPTTYDKFIELEQKESQKEGSGQQLTKTAQMANIKIVNNSNDIMDLYKKIDALLKNLKC